MFEYYYCFIYWEKSKISFNLLKERNARRLFCNALDEYIAKAFEKSSLISKHETKKKEQAEGVYDALMNAKEMEEKIIVTLRKKHFDQIKLEELREEWERLGPSKQKSKLGDSILHEIELIDAELMVELKFGAFAVSQGLHVKWRRDIYKHEKRCVCIFVS